MTMTKSKLFSPYRAVGLITDDLPVAFQSRGSAFYVTASTGHSFHIYDCDRLNLLFVGPYYENEKITALSCYQDWTFVGTERGQLSICQRAKQVTKLALATDHAILQIEAIGTCILVLQSNNTLHQYDLDHFTLIDTLELTPDVEEEFFVTSFMHPNTYLNKILIATREGDMRLWNIKTRKLIHSFPPFSAPISCLVQSPVLDIVAVGLMDGSICVYHLKESQCLFKLFQQGGSVKSLAFRSDGKPHLASGNAQGDLSIWDLDEKKLLHYMKCSHEQQITSLYYLPNQPILLSSGNDNSIKEWIFESVDSTPRLLRFRTGHHGTPMALSYYDPDGHFILSAAKDRSFRNFSVFRDSQSSELSQGAGLTKLAQSRQVPTDVLKHPMISAFSFCLTRARDWDNILSCHLNCNYALSWSFENLRLGAHQFYSKDGSVVKSVLVSPDGNYGVLGNASGSIDVYNIQSGLYQFTLKGTHTASVTGLALNVGNRLLVSSSLDGQLVLWDFGKRKPSTVLHATSAISKLVYHSESDLLAIACDDHVIRVYDIDTAQLVRQFSGHSHSLTSLSFSSDGKWLISCSMDRSIKTWDLLSGQLLDSFCLDTIPVAAAIAPLGDFLATAQVGSVGIQLWANASYYSTNALLPSEASSVTEPSMPASFWEETSTPQSNAPSSFTLADVHASSWQRLLNLDVIKERNKPKQPPKAPEKAPFFLDFSTVGPANSKKEAKGTSDKDDSLPRQKASAPEDQLSLLTEFSQKLLSAAHTKEFVAFHHFAKSLSAPAIDLELRLLSSQQLLSSFLDYIEAQLGSKQDFDLCQTYLNIVLKTHGDRFVGLGLQSRLTALYQLQYETWHQLENAFQQTLCLVDYAKSRY